MLLFNKNIRVKRTLDLISTLVKLFGNYAFFLTIMFLLNNSTQEVLTCHFSLLTSRFNMAVVTI